MMLRRWLVLLVMLTLLIWPGPAAAGGGYKDQALISEVLELVREYHISNPDSGVLTEGAVRGMLEVLDDPYTVYFSPEELQAFTDALNGDLIGVGVELVNWEGYPAVIGVFKGTPAQRGGLQAGDLILAVDGKSTQGRPLDEVAKEIRGPRGAPVVLTIKRGERVFDVSLRRDDVHVPSVSYEMLAGQTGYLAVHSFGEQTTGEFEAALNSLRRQGMDSLIIDLRGNGGGYLQAAVDMLENFLPYRGLVVSTVDNRGYREEIRTTAEPVVSGLPLAVLTDLGSASASEIMAGALRDYDLALLVGGITYGKGMVQTVIPLSTGGALKLTVAKYLTPGGVDIDLTGLQPDHQVLTPALQKEVAWLLLNPGVNPKLTFSGSGEVLFNGRRVNLTIDVLRVDNIDYLPLRTILEAMLYQVFWTDDGIRIVDRGTEKKFFKINENGAGGGQGLLVRDGVSYLGVDLCRQLNINIVKEGNAYILEREL